MTTAEPLYGLLSPRTGYTAQPLQNCLNGWDALTGDESHAVRAECSISGCEKPRRARGWCGMHYWRWSHHGDPEWQPPETKGECAFDGCERAVSARGYCETHYSRLRRTGTVEDRIKVSIIASGPARGTVERDRLRFLSKIDERGPHLCWPWLGTILSNGYGQFYAQGKRHLAHRYAYRLFIGAIREGLTVDHVWARGCMRHSCVNPHHLEAVTQLENTRRALLTRRELGRSA